MLIEITRGILLTKQKLIQSSLLRSPLSAFSKRAKEPRAFSIRTENRRKPLGSSGFLMGFIVLFCSKNRTACGNTSMGYSWWIPLFKLHFSVLLLSPPPMKWRLLAVEKNKFLWESCCTWNTSLKLQPIPADCEFLIECIGWIWCLLKNNLMISWNAEM